MGQPKKIALGVFLGMALVLLAAGGCERGAESSRRPTAKSPRVASLVPAATDLLVGMGAVEHLVAISNYDVDRPEIQGLPRVGDYQSFDWERISAVGPDVMIVFMTPERMPAGLKQRADRLGIRLVNVRTERLEDIFSELEKLGQVVQEPAKAAAAACKLRAQLDAVRSRTKGRRRVRTLLVRDEDAAGVVGRGNFLNDILEIAGGENVIQTTGWPSIDRERLVALNPEVVLVLLPEASEQVVGEAKRFWSGLTQVPAVKAGRVHVLREWYVQHSGMQVGKLAACFEHLLHPAAVGNSEESPVE